MSEQGKIRLSADSEKPTDPPAPPGNTTVINTQQQVPKPPSNNELRRRRPSYLKIILVAVAVFVLGGVGYVGHIIFNTASGVSSYCSQKTNTANQQAEQQAGELRGALHDTVLFGSKPQITTSTDDDCLDGDGTGSAQATYLAHDVGLTQAESAVMQVLGGAAQPLTLTDNSNTDSPAGVDNGESFINYLLTTVTTAEGKSYDVQFQLAHAYDCPATGCRSSDAVVQQYGLQNAPITRYTLRLLTKAGSESVQCTTDAQP
jgi:hypothetical protein